MRALAATLLILVGTTWTDADATARDRKKSKKQTTTQVAEQPQQQKRISLTIDLSELRDSINREADLRYAETLEELNEADRAEYQAMMEKFMRLTRLRSVFDQSKGGYLGDLAVDIAKEHLGKPYVWGAEGPDQFDCSGFMMYVYRQIGIKLPRTSREQFLLGEPVDIPDLKKGDLVFWSGRRGSVGATIGHVGMISDIDYERGYFYFIHANSSKKGVSISRSDERYFLLHYKGARRIIQEE